MSTRHSHIIRQGLFALILATATHAVYAQIPVTDGAAQGQLTTANQTLTTMSTSIGSTLGTDTSAIKKSVGDSLGKDTATIRDDTATIRDQTKKIQDFLDTGSGKTGKSGKVNDDEAKDGGSDFYYMKTTTKEVLDGTKKYEPDANKNTFYGNSDGANCNGSAGQANFDNCTQARNILASHLNEIKNISIVLESRNEALKAIMTEPYDKYADLQIKQYQMTALNTMIANDNMRLQVALAAYNSRRELYRQIQTEAANNRNNGAKGATAKTEQAAKIAVGITAGVVTFGAGTKALRLFKPKIFER